MSSGLHTLELYTEYTMSFPLPCKSISLGSLSWSLAILHLPAGRMLQTSSAALMPCSSESNISTTSSQELSHSKFFLNVPLADCAPLGRETTGHLLSKTCETVRQSISPSVITTRLPPLGFKCCPKKKEGVPSH